MTEPTPNPSPAPSPAPNPAPAPAPAATKPDFLPDTYWDATAGAINTDEFGKHYGEIAGAAQRWTEHEAARSALPQKPEDYKLDVKLPDTVKVPDGLTLKVDDKDPRVPLLRAVAHQHGLSQDAVNALVALDAQMKIADHTAETARVAEENKKLGDKAPDRIAAVTNWAKGLKDRGEFTAAEYDELRVTASTAAGVTLLEKIMAKAAGAVPGNQPPREPAPEPKTWAQRMYPNLPSAARSA